MYNLALRWVWNSEEAMEIVQETFISLWRQRKRVTLDTAKSYIFRICINHAKNRLRSRRVRSNFLQLTSASPQLESPFEQDQREKILKEKIDRLPHKLKVVILLSDLAELSYKEISEILKIPIGTVGSRRNQALKKLKIEINESYKEIF